jgi:cation diffusion facilitator CzcD-associated flavoprotein CzcO
VVKAAPDDDGTWSVLLDGGERRRYGGVVVANGHNWAPRRPRLAGEFSGKVIHSSEYWDASVFVGRRVLVVGCGNSGADIACEAATVADHALLSLRRGYHFMPKYIGRIPADQVVYAMARLRVPLRLRQLSTVLAVRLLFGSAAAYGVPNPDHRLWETHIVNNTRILHHLSHGELEARPPIDHTEGSSVHFSDGTADEVDVIVLATGYETTFPFLDEGELGWRDGRPDLYLNVFHPRYDNFFVLGLMQPTAGQWRLVDRAASLVAESVVAGRSGTRAAAAFRRAVQQPPPDTGFGIRFVDSPRHRFETEHAGYLRELRRLERILRKHSRR